MAGTRTKKDEEEKTEEKSEGGGIEYIDKGSYTLEIDRRGPMERRTTLPKSARDVPVPGSVAEEIRAHAESDPTIEDADLVVPPVEKEDD
jgi:hypothetical protein